MQRKGEIVQELMHKHEQAVEKARKKQEKQMKL
jgi:hypothetical protein